jgi:hypothetical protein
MSEDNDNEDGGLLDNIEPGSRVQNALNRLQNQDMSAGHMMGENMPDASDFGANLNVDVETPESPGLAVMGNKGLVGSVRRSNNLPVIRDKISEVVS